MELLCGTQTGVFRAPLDAVDDAVRVLDTDRVMRIRRFGERTYAATRSGLYRSLDAGRSWNRIETPHREVYAVLEAPVGERLYAGTHPAHLYVSRDAGESFEECVGLQELPSRETWHTPRHRNKAHVRSLQSTGREGLLAGIEVGGVHTSDDGGRTWSERREGVHDDVHHVLVDDDRWIVSTGNGLYRSRDRGRSWTRLDVDLEGQYFREAIVHDGRLYASGTAGPPPTWDGPRDTDARLFESHDGDDTLEAVPYAGGPGEFVLSWAADGDDVYAGTTAGLVVHREADGWFGVGRVPTGIPSMALVEG